MGGGCPTLQQLAAVIAIAACDLERHDATLELAAGQPSEQLVIIGFLLRVGLREWLAPSLRWPYPKPEGIKSHSIKPSFLQLFPSFFNLSAIHLVATYHSNTPQALLLPPAIPSLRRQLQLGRLVGKLLEQQPDLAPRASLHDLARLLARLMNDMKIWHIPQALRESLAASRNRTPLRRLTCLRRFSN